MFQGTFFIRLTLVVVLSVPMFLGQLFGQYHLPKPAVLVDNEVSIIRVKQTPLRMENVKGKDITPKNFDPTTYWVATFYLNAQGLVDSVYHSPANSFYKKEVFRYDSLNNVVESKTILSDGKVEQRSLVERVADGQLYFRSWEQGQLMVEIRGTADSIIYETIRHRIYTPEHQYYQYTYDLEKDIATETWFHGDWVKSLESKQWISENGVPRQFIYTTFEHPYKHKKPKTETHTLEVDSAGVVINKLNGQVFDPFRLDNFFKRHDIFQGIALPHNSTFTKDHLITDMEVSSLYTFDGDEMVYLYQFEYE